MRPAPSYPHPIPFPIPPPPNPSHAASHPSLQSSVHPVPLFQASLQPHSTPACTLSPMLFNLATPPHPGLYPVPNVF